MIQNEEKDTIIMDNKGVKMKQADMYMFEKALLRQFPDGLTIPLPDYRLADLMDLKEDIDNEREYMRDDVTFDGLIAKRNDHIVTDGKLRTELHIPASLYGRIYPDEESYPLDSRQADDMDWEDRAATRLLHEHGNDLTSAAVGVTIREDIMPHLYIEGVPFPDFMQDVMKANCVSDIEARQLMALKELYRQPLDGHIEIPKCLESLMASVTDKYDRNELSLEQQRSLNGELVSLAEQYLTNCSILNVEMKNFQASFEKAEAARQATIAINSRFAPAEAFALRKDNNVEVSLFTSTVGKRAEIMNVFRCDKLCTGITDKPFRNLEYQQRAVALCFNGQLLHGHVGVEGLQTAHHYGLTATESNSKLLPQANPAHPEMSFSTNDRTQRFMRDFKGEFIPVVHFNYMSDFTRQTVVNEEGIVLNHDSKLGIDKVEVMGQVKGYPFTRKELSEKDARLYIRYQSKDNNEQNRGIITAMMLDKYFRSEIETAYAKEQKLVDSIHERMNEQKRLYDRITRPTLYGKVNDLRVRCMIDGVQQSGRPVSPQDVKELKFLVDAARDLGRETLNYRNFLHEDRITEIAANAYSDILHQDITHDRSRGMGR